MASDEIKVFNPYTGALETEKVYKEEYIRFAYEKPMGKLAAFAAVKRSWFSNWQGGKMKKPSSRSLVEPFIRDYDIDESEFLKPTSSFRSFNDFFIRKLKPGARPIDKNPDAAIFPADGRQLAYADVSEINAIYAKGQSFDLPKLLGDKELAGKYAKGSVLISRLAPVDYHRYHFPVSGHAGPPKLINGVLKSVSPIALRRQIGILTENKRVLTMIRSDNFGQVLMIEIGATCVGSIQQTYLPNTRVEKGQEKGFFEFGGSMVITLFEPGQIELAEDLLDTTGKGFEMYVKMGDGLGVARSAAAKADREETPPEDDSPTENVEAKSPASPPKPVPASAFERPRLDEGPDPTGLWEQGFVKRPRPMAVPPPLPSKSE